jgi:hypothetical protein
MYVVSGLIPESCSEVDSTPDQSWVRFSTLGPTILISSSVSQTADANPSWDSALEQTTPFQLVFIKLKLPLVLILHHAMKTCRRMKVHLHSNLALRTGEWSASRPVRFTPWEKSQRCPLDIRLDVPQRRCSEEKILCFCSESNPGNSARNLVTITD